MSWGILGCPWVIRLTAGKIIRDVEGGGASGLISRFSHLGMFVTTGCSSRRQFVATASRQDTSSRQQITDSGRQVTASGQFYKPSQTQESKYSSYALLLLCRLKCKNGSTFNERNFM